MEVGQIIEYDGITAQIIDTYYSAGCLLLILSNDDIISAELVTAIKD